MKILSRITFIFSILLFALGIFFIKEGFDKKDNYYNSDYYQKNAYVGGDAYNYITNGTYFAGYCALGGSFVICGSVFYIGSLLISNNSEDNE